VLCLLKFRFNKSPRHWPFADRNKERTGGELAYRDFQAKQSCFARGYRRQSSMNFLFLRFVVGDEHDPLGDTVAWANFKYPISQLSCQ